jgi:hypothetical protein
MACIAITARGTPCTRPASYFEGHCGTHHNSLYTKNPEYRARYLAHVAAIPERRRQEDDQRAQRFAAEVAAAAEQSRLEEARKQAAAQTRNQQAVENAPNFSPALIVSYTRTLANIWNTANLEGYDVIRAYIVLKHRSSKHDGFNALIRAAVAIVNQSMHPVHRQYNDVPLAERQAALAELTAALAPYGEIPMRELPTRDSIHQIVHARLRAEEERVRQAQLEARRVAAEAAHAARHAQIMEDLRVRPVVFQRDPEGTVNLAAFARDHESVHRSSVQNTTHKAVLTLLSRPLREGQETLAEIITAFHERRLVRFTTDTAKERAITEITHDYFETEAFSQKYGDVLDHVWAYIHPHENRRDLIIRLAQEVCEGLGSCGNGKMARLINVLRGFDETIEFDAPRELFHTQFAKLRDRPVGERASAATEVFNEFNIPEGERNTWLEPLLEE